MKLVARILWISVAALTLFVVLVPWIAYWRGLSLIPDGRLEARNTPVPTQATELFWRSLDGVGEPRLIVNNPYQLVGQVWERTREPDRPRPADELSSLAAHYLLGDSPGLHGWRRRMALTSAQIWIARNQTAEEAVALVLTHSGYGQGQFGIEAAAQHYFGRTTASLAEPELALLIVLRAAPDRFDPWCDPGQLNLAVVREFPHRFGSSGAMVDTLLKPPAGVCE